jgi:hypothetical protein
MSSNVQRGGGPPRLGPAETYWRRRAFVLAGTLVVLGLLVWACSGGGGRPVGAGAPTATASPAGQQQAAQRTPQPTARPTVKPTARPSHRPTAARSGAAAAAAHKGDCSPKDLVLSLYASGKSFGSGDHPSFRLDVVNVGSGACAFDSGPRSLNLVIMSGRDRIWSSADCASGPASKQVRLQRGVPYTRNFSWDQVRSSPGCPAGHTAARPGMYTATAFGGGAVSQTDVFNLHSG